MEWNLCLISKTKPKLSLDILTRTAKFQKIENYKLCPDMNLLELPYITGDVILCTEKAMASHSSTFAWKIPWTEEPGGLQSMGSLESDMTERLHFHFSLSCIGEGNGNPLQCSCLENPRDGEAWWAAVSGVAQNRTRLKRVSSSSSNFVQPLSTWKNRKSSHT